MGNAEGEGFYLSAGKGVIGWNMTLYLLHPKGEPVQIYARDPKDIVGLVEYYHNQAKNDGKLDDPHTVDWVKNIPKPDEIRQAESGRINYHVGMVNLNDAAEGDFFSEHLQVTPDFLVAVSPEAILYFEMHLQKLSKSLQQLKRGQLYKFQVHGGMYFSSLNFIPEDVMNAMLNYDLRPHIEKGIKARRDIEKIASGNPIIATPAIADKRAEQKRLDDLAGN